MEAATLTLGSQECTHCTRAWASTGDDRECPYCGADQRPPERAPEIELVNHTLTVALEPGGPVSPPPEHAHDGNPAITAWCDTCDCTVVPMRSRRCGWCGTELEDVP